MRTCIPATLLVLATLACNAHAAGTVTLNWQDPANYTDAGRNVVDRERSLLALGAHMQAWGALLPDGQTLRLEVLDLDLAGEVRHWPGWGMDEIRVMGDRPDWPRMQLRYTLQAAGQTLHSGEARLSDMGYLLRQQRDGALAYEKRMVDAWFRRTIAPQAATR
jgi:hypothetical protein